MRIRALKQILYFLFYLAILGLIVFLIYQWFIKPTPNCFDNRKNQGETDIDCGGPCQPCEIQSLKPLESQKIRFFQNQNQTIITAEILNLNDNFGADNFTYTIDFYNKNEEKVYSISKNSFIYPQEVKTIFEITDKVNYNDIFKIQINFSNLHWTSKDNFKKPEIEITEKNLNLEKPIKIQGSLINKGNSDATLVRLIGIIYDKYNLPLAASKTEIGKLDAKKQKTFEINFPYNLEINEAGKIDIYIEAK